MSSEWMTLEELESPRKWARRLYDILTPLELALVVDALDPDVLAGDDRSRSAAKRTRKPNMRSLVDDLAHRAAFAKLDQPFGKKAA